MAGTATESGTFFAEGVGGRLSAPKSDLYHRAIMGVESRANPMLARYMLASDVAYVLSCAELGVIPADDARKLLACLLDLLAQPDALPTTVEGGDIVLQREAWVIDRVGRAVGARLHTARNRGESIRNLMPRMFFRQALWSERKALFQLLSVLHAKAKPVLHELAPLYHHLQHASVTTLGEYLLAWAASLHPYLARLEQSDARIDIGPPPQTSRHEIIAIQEAVTRRLGFSRMYKLRQQIHVTEDQFIDPFFGLVMVNIALSRIAQDLRIYMTTEFDFFDLSDTHASGSSFLPQKKNPFGLQTVIGGAAVSMGRLSGQLASSIAPCEELDSVFNAGSLYQQAADIIGWTQFMAEVIERGTFRLDALRAKATHGYAGASEAIDKLVFEADVPLRSAHHEIGAFVRAELEGGPPVYIKAQLERELGRPIAMDNADLVKIIRGEVVPETALALPAVDASWREIEELLARDAKALSGLGPVETALSQLIAEAQNWLRR